MRTTTVNEKEQTLRAEIVSHLSKRYAALPDGPDKDRALHMVRVYVSSIPYSDLVIRWVEIVGRNGK